MRVLRLRRLHVALVAIALLVAAVIAAVLLPSDEDRARDALRRAPEKLLGRGPVRLELQLSLVEATGETRSVESTSEVDAVKDRAHTTLAEVVGPGDLELVAVGPILFLSVPEDRRDAIGARWLRVGTPSAAVARGAGVGPLPDPLTVLHALEGARGEVARVRTSGGLTLYRFDVSVETLARQGGADHEAWATTLAPLGPTLSGEAYLDAEGIPRRLRLVGDLAARGKVVAVLDVDEFRQGLMIGVPPDDATHGVTTIAEALRLVSAP